jgi:hypothetical protein
MTGSVSGGSAVREPYDLRSSKETEKEEEGVIDIHSESLPLIHQLHDDVLIHIFNYVAGADQRGNARNLCAI